MATSGSVSVDLNNIGNTLDAAFVLSENVIGGIKDQGDLIGLAIGLVIAIGLLFGLIFLVIGVVPKLIGKIKGIR